MKFLLWVILLFPLFAFCVAGIIELRSDKSLANKLCNLVPCVLGIGVFAMASGLAVFLHFGNNGRVMALVSTIIASSGAFMRYSDKRSRVLITLAGLELAILYMFFNEPIV